MSWIAGIRDSVGVGEARTPAAPKGGRLAAMYARAASPRTTTVLAALVGLICLTDLLRGHSPATYPVLAVVLLALAVNLSATLVRGRGLIGDSELSQATSVDTEELTIEPTHSFDLTQDTIAAHTEVRTVLRSALGFHLLSKHGEWSLMARGISYRRLNWLYHAGILACLCGVLLTYLLAYEGTVTLVPGAPASVEAGSAGRLQGFFRIGRSKPAFTMTAVDSSTVRTESPRLDYPDDAASRVATGLGWGALSYAPPGAPGAVVTGRTTTLLITGDDGTPSARALSTGAPLKYGGYRFVHRGFAYRYRIRVGDNPLILEADSGTEVLIPGLTQPVVFGELVSGTLGRIDGTVEDIEPHASLAVFAGVDLYGRRRYEDAGTIHPGERVKLNGTAITVAGVTESPVIGYRYDPGAGLLKWAAIFAVALLAIRTYAPWYGIAYRVVERSGIARLEMRITSTGITSDADALSGRVQRELSRDEIPLTPMP